LHITEFSSRIWIRLGLAFDLKILRTDVKIKLINKLIKKLIDGSTY